MANKKAENTQTSISNSQKSKKTMKKNKPGRPTPSPPNLTKAIISRIWRNRKESGLTGTSRTFPSDLPKIITSHQTTLSSQNQSQSRGKSKGRTPEKSRDKWKGGKDSVIYKWLATSSQVKRQWSGFLYWAPPLVQQRSAK